MEDENSQIVSDIIIFYEKLYKNMTTQSSSNFLRKLPFLLQFPPKLFS